MASGWFRDAGILARLTRDLPVFLRSPLTYEQASARAADRLRNRETRFLTIAERAVYGHSGSPYLELLRSCGCEYGDLKTLVAQRGLEGAMSHLAASGVYVTFDEFKGRREVVRGSRRFAFRDVDFDNPQITSHFEVRSGGTRGPATAVKTHLDFVTELATSTALAFRVHGLTGHDHIIWLVSGVTPMLIYARLGRPPLAWLYSVDPLPFTVRAGSQYLAVLSRLLGRPLPHPAFHDLTDPSGMAARLAALLGAGKKITVTTYASSAVRISAAAREQGLDLRGVCYITLGEPFTTGKRTIVEDSGAQALVRYAFTEGGILGYACGSPRESDDLHFFTDCYGLGQRRRPVGATGPDVDAFLVTSLLPSAPKILLNVETGDYGLIERRECGCEMGTAGLTTHVSGIRSFEKLSGEGMTFVQTDLLRILDEVLPAKFGGTGADYQVLEEEENGILRLSLIISPRLGAVDEERARDAFLEALGHEGGLERLGAEFWRRANTVTVKREWPKATKAGKILPFQLLK
ncbi:MAG: hypothetical protein A2Z07_07650 [Armatimonadetes bacterium RBG_16_67_12]|nr:MAG: hypothetical protein A2Z07_07650 [Armatimonadetes bacterium RBG_16_67_12]